MKVKIYLNEWFVNAGIIGFLRIMEHSNNTGIEIRDNYIELDTNILKEFNKYYFKYFSDKTVLIETSYPETQRRSAEYLKKLGVL